MSAANAAARKRRAPNAMVDPPRPSTPTSFSSRNPSSGLTLQQVIALLDKRLLTLENSVKEPPIHPQLIHPQAIHPQAIHPQAIHPQAIHPQAIHPQAIHPQAIHPQAIQTQPIQPQPIQPHPTKAQSTNNKSIEQLNQQFAIEQQLFFSQQLSEITEEFNSRYAILAEEIDNVKSMLLKLQTYTMEVNKTLLEERIRILSDVEKAPTITELAVQDLAENIGFSISDKIDTERFALADCTN
jgi:hypothetical protein